jgi:hypothetical protein
MKLFEFVSEVELSNDQMKEVVFKNAHGKAPEDDTLDWILEILAATSIDDVAANLQSKF